MAQLATERGRDAATVAPRLHLCAICQNTLAYLDRTGQLQYSHDSSGHDLWQPQAENSSSMMSIDHHRSYESWQLSLEKGCHICKLLNESIPSTMQTVLESLRDAGPFKTTCYTTTPNNRDVPIELEFRVNTDSLERRGFANGLGSLSFTVQEVIGPLSFVLKPLVKITENSTRSPSAWSCVESWLSVCETKHERCISSRFGIKPWYPTRLLCLEDPGSGLPAIRLIETAHTKPQGPYLTLSHCWGSGTHVTATRANLQDLMQQVTGLPKSFEDAVWVTRKLGYRYLWIDSLCIVQDDKDDWIREASSMADVYQHGHCNIAATAAKDSSGGLFWDRADHLLLGDFEVHITNTRSNYELRNCYTVKLEVDRSPLQQRAWVFQEQLLSPRTIHFGEKQILWECPSAYASEAAPQGMSEESYRTSLGKQKFSSLLNAALSNSTLSESSVPAANIELETRRLAHAVNDRVSHQQRRYGLWAAIVEQYTSRALTKGTDKLPALSGIAKTLAPVFGHSRYLAGIWNDDTIHCQLAWRRSTAWPLRDRPKYRAPTWSWASIDSPVVYTEAIKASGFSPGMEILDIKTTLSTTDPTSSVSEGFLLARGQLNRVSISGMFMYFEGKKLDSTELRLDVGGRRPAELYAIPLLQEVGLVFQFDSEQGYTKVVDTYLILKPVATVPGTYERYGIAAVSHTVLKEGDGPQIPRRVVNAEEAACEEYLGSVQGHKIRIV